MTYKKSLLCLFAIIPALFFAFRDDVAAESVVAKSSFVPSLPTTGEKYIVDKKQSIVKWKGSMALAGKGAHEGYAYLSKGELKIENDQLVGGTVEVDMNTIADKDHGSDNNLVKHLKDPDFFDIEKFPTAAFSITKVVPAVNGTVDISGLLMLKGITNPATFPGKVEVKNGIVTATGKLVIDRTKWGVHYKSGQFFGTIADEAIADNIEFEMKIVAKK